MVAQEINGKIDMCDTGVQDTFQSYLGAAHTKLNPLQLYKLLPGTNCKQCEMTCMAFATRLALREVKLEQCAPLLQPQYAEQLRRLRDLIEPMLTAEETGIKLDDEKCTGCGNCVVVCPVDASAEAGTSLGKAARTTSTVFRVEDGKVKIINLQKCRRFPPDRMNCRVCEQGCYVGAIEIW